MNNGQNVQAYKQNNSNGQIIKIIEYFIQLYSAEHITTL